METRGGSGACAGDEGGVVVAHADAMHARLPATMRRLVIVARRCYDDVHEPE